MLDIPFFVPAIAGALVLAILCVTDFRSRVVRKPSILYGLSLMLFLAINLLIYWLLVAVVLDAGVTLTGVAEKPLALITPMVVAFLYFGAGASTFTLGRLKFNFYEKLVATFAKWFRCSIDPSEVRKAVEKGSYDHLKAVVKRLHEDAESRNWDELTEEWEDIRSDAEHIEKHIEDLEETGETLGSHPSPEVLGNYAERLGERASSLREVLIRRHRLHLYRFIDRNAKSEEDVAMMLEGIPDAWVIAPPETINVTWFRSLVAGFFFGFVIGLVALAGQMAGTSALTPGIAAVAVSVFAGIFYFSLRSETFTAAGIIGGLAGLAGQLVWGALAAIAPGAEADLTWEMMWRLLLGSMLSGVLYGGATGLLIFLYRKAIRERMGKPLFRVLTVAGLGWLAFFLIAALVPRIAEGAGEGNRMLQWILMGVIGALLNLGLAYACQLLRCQKDEQGAKTAIAT